LEIGIVFKFLHISTMIAAVTLALGPSFVFDRVAASGDVLATRAFLSRMAIFDRLIPGLFVSGAVFGLLAAVTIGFDLLEPWLVVAYVLFIGMMGMHATVGSRWRAALGRSLAAVPAGVASSPEVAGVASAAVGQVLYWVTAGATLLIVFDMVAKPFS
jgi:hypothetical protein